MTKELDYKWIFEEHFSLTSVAEGFNNNDIERFNRDPLKSIVREAIQNSSDALDSNNGQRQVVIKIKRGSIRKDLLPGFSDIQNHIKSCSHSSENDDTAKREINRHISAFEAADEYSYIEIADYNTTGMDEDRLKALTQSNATSKKQNNRAQGSKGVGKAAYFAASYLRTIIVSTYNDDGFRFRGTTKISTHEDPYKKDVVRKGQGFYGFIDPISQERVPEMFRRDEKGSSVFIIGSWEYEDFKENVIKEVLRNYWLAIETGQLIVHVEDTLLDNKNLEEYLKCSFNELRDYRTGEKQNPLPYYLTYKNGSSFKGNIINIGDCKLWLYRNEEFNLGAVARFRQTKMHIYKDNDLNIGYAGVFLCDNNDGNEFLRDIENDAHDSWNPGNNALRRNDAIKTLNAIREFIKDKYYEYTGKEDEGSFSVESLDDIFSFNEVNLRPGRNSAPIVNKKKDSEIQSRDRFIKHHNFKSINKNGEYVYSLTFNAKRSKRNQILRVSIGTDSSKDRINVLSVGGSARVEDGFIIMDVTKGSNYLDDIVIDSPFLVAPSITIE